MPYTTDKLIKDAGAAVLAKPCDVVAMIGYLAVPGGGGDGGGGNGGGNGGGGNGGGGGNYRLYQDHNFRQWIEIDPTIIRGQSPSKDPRTKGQSVVWLDATKTIRVCAEVPVRCYEPQPPGAIGPGDEDLTYKHPR